MSTFVTVSSPPLQDGSRDRGLRRQGWERRQPPSPPLFRSPAQSAPRAPCLRLVLPAHSSHRPREGVGRAELGVQHGDGRG